MDEMNRNRGFTLVELIITVAILAIIVAPFLSAFVIAGNNNLKGSESQNAADVAEEIAEEFKAKPLSLLENQFTCTKDPTGTIYTFDMSNSDLQSLVAVPSGYTASVKLEPSASSVINGDMPTISNLKGDNTMSIVSAFYINDTKVQAAHGGSGYYRKCTIKMEYDPSYDAAAPDGKYIYSLDIEYFNSTGSVAKFEDIISKSFKYDEHQAPPTLYMVYAAMSDNDQLFIENEIEESDLPTDDDGDEIPVTVCLASQQDVPSKLKTSNFSIKEYTGATFTTYGFVSYVKDKADKVCDIYTNLSVAGTPIESTYDSTLLSSIESNRIYDITVEVKHGSKTSKFTSTKLTLG